MTDSSPLLRHTGPREAFEWRRDGHYGDQIRLWLMSHVWRGIPWEHSLILCGDYVGSRMAILYVTGGDANDLDVAEAQSIAECSGLPVAMLFNIPNQPLFDRSEDDLIAFTFDEYLESGDSEWPLLFPMVRSVLRAMDTLQAFTEGKCEQFVVVGASKRGWTTWLAAATGDPRIIGIAPMVIDNLNFLEQMQHQQDSWGAYSEQIEDYTSRELQEKASTELGQELVRMMDPYHYLEQIRCPILIVNAANDRYWTVDALSLYWNDLPGSRRCLIVPNVGHTLGDKIRMIETVSAFGDACAAGELLPEIHADFVRKGFEVEGSISGQAPSEVTVWRALSDSLDFRDSEWEPVANRKSFAVETGSTNAALMVEARFVGRTGAFSLSVPVRVFPA